jgi:hypothetical protein
MFWLPLVNLLNNSINKKLTLHQTDVTYTHNKKKDRQELDYFLVLRLFLPLIVELHTA